MAAPCSENEIEIVLSIAQGGRRGILIGGSSLWTALSSEKHCDAQEKRASREKTPKPNGSVVKVSHASELRTPHQSARMHFLVTG